MDGYKRALVRAGLKVTDDYIIAELKGDVGTKQRGAEAMGQLLSLKPRPDGVFCFNDPLAMGAMNYALDHGLRIPEDIAVIGCGNLHYDDSLRVPLSSIDQHSRKIGEEAARLALRILNSKVPPKSETVVLRPELISAQVDPTPRSETGVFKSKATGLACLRQPSWEQRAIPVNIGTRRLEINQTTVRSDLRGDHRWYETVVISKRAGA